MNTICKFATIVTAAAASLAIAGAARAAEQYSFPSASGAGIAASTPVFQSPDAKAMDGSHLATVAGVSGSEYRFAPPPAPTGGRSHDDRFGMRARAADAYAYRFFGHTLSTASYANYAADYARLFAPGYAVTAWTDRMFGVIDAGYGGAVDSWTAGAYYMSRMRGPARRRETAPDLSTMPEFRPHPELERAPTFSNQN